MFLQIWKLGQKNLFYSHIITVVGIPYYILPVFFCDGVQWYRTLTPLLMATHYKNTINSELGKYSYLLLLFQPDYHNMIQQHQQLLLITFNVKTKDILNLPAAKW
jgi:hypothetical protein